MPATTDPRPGAPVVAEHRGGTGEPLVLLHGFTDTWRAWTRLLPALQEHHRVFAPTLPGHHGGEAFPDGTSLSVPATLDMVEAALDREGIERAHIAGSSLGGWLALELAARGRALSVVGICPAGGWDHGSPQERAALRFFRINDRLLRVGRPLLRTIAARPRLRRLALRDLVADPSGVDAGSAWAMLEGAAECAIVPDALDLAASGDMFGELGEIDCPVRIVYATRDKIVRWPGHYGRMQRLLPDAEYVELTGMGHLPMWDDPAAVARSILEVTAASRA